MRATLGGMTRIVGRGSRLESGGLAGPTCAMLEESRMNPTEDEELEELAGELGLSGLSGLESSAVGRVGLCGARDMVSSSYFFRSAVRWRVKRETLGLDFVGVDGPPLGFFLTTLRAGGVSESAFWASL